MALMPKDQGIKTRARSPYLNNTEAINTTTLDISNENTLMANTPSNQDGEIPGGNPAITIQEGTPSFFSLPEQSKSEEEIYNILTIAALSLTAHATHPFQST